MRCSRRSGVPSILFLPPRLSRRALARRHLGMQRIVQHFANARRHKGLRHARRVQRPRALNGTVIPAALRGLLRIQHIPLACHAADAPQALARGLLQHKNNRHPLVSFPSFRGRESNPAAGRILGTSLGGLRPALRLRAGFAAAEALRPVLTRSVRFAHPYRRPAPGAAPGSDPALFVHARARRFRPRPARQITCSSAPGARGRSSAG